jgi:hypothetical protein
MYILSFRNAIAQPKKNPEKHCSNESNPKSFFVIIKNNEHKTIILKI